MINYYTYGAITSASPTVVDFLARLMSHNSNTCSIWLLIKLLSVYASIFQFALQTAVHASNFKKKSCVHFMNLMVCTYFWCPFPLFAIAFEPGLWQYIHIVCTYWTDHHCKRDISECSVKRQKTSRVKEMLSQHGSLMQYNSSENRIAF